MSAATTTCPRWCVTEHPEFDQHHDEGDFLKLDDNRVIAVRTEQDPWEDSPKVRLVYKEGLSTDVTIDLTPDQARELWHALIAPSGHLPESQQ